MILEIINAIRGVAAEFQARHLPHEIVENYPPDHPLAGLPAGRRLLSRDGTGAFSYGFAAAPRGAPQPLSPIAERVVAHRFGDLESLRRWLEATSKVYLDGELFGAHGLTVYQDEDHPERGAVALPFPRHPTWERWKALVGVQGKPRTLEHNDLVSVVRDGGGEIGLDVQRAVSVFSAAKTITYDADADQGMGESVKLDFGARAGATAMRLPSTFEAKFPVFIGAWVAGEEPVLTAKFALRVVPPKRATDEWEPTFALTWTNAAEVELEARALLAAAVREALGEHEVFLGHPDVRRYVVPAR